MLQKCHNRCAFLGTNWYKLALSVLQSNRNNNTQPYRALSTLSSSAEPLTSTCSKTTVNESKTLKHIPKQDSVIQNKENQLHSERKLQCSGFKKCDGQRCKRMINSSSTSNQIAYCFDHGPVPGRKPRTPKKKKGRPKMHSFLRTNISAMCALEEDIATQKLLDCWHLWIKPSINKETKELLCREMKRPLSTRDQEGYIYAYSFENGPLASTDKFAYFKVGRTKDPHRRMYQVSILCNHVPKIIELFPSFPMMANKPFMSTNLETLEQTIQDLPKCPATHRVERLILLELSSLYEKADIKCPECNRIHREWIRVPRKQHPDGTLMTDQELWSLEIRPTILHWIRYGVLASALRTTSTSSISSLNSPLS